MVFKKLHLGNVSLTVESFDEVSCSTFETLFPLQSANSNDCSSRYFETERIVRFDFFGIKGDLAFSFAAKKVRSFFKFFVNFRWKDSIQGGALIVNGHKKAGTWCNESEGGHR